MVLSELGSFGKCIFFLASPLTSKVNYKFDSHISDMITKLNFVSFFILRTYRAILLILVF